MEHHGRFTTDRARAIGEEIGIDWASSSFEDEQFRMGLEVELEHGRRDPATNVTETPPRPTRATSDVCVQPRSRRSSQSGDSISTRHRSAHVGRSQTTALARSIDDSGGFSQRWQSFRLAVSLAWSAQILERRVQKISR